MMTLYIRRFFSQPSVATVLVTVLVLVNMIYVVFACGLVDAPPAEVWDEPAPRPSVIFPIPDITPREV